MTTVNHFNHERVQNNLEVLTHLCNETQNPTQPEILKKYTGWGGLREAIYTKEVFLKLRNTLTETQIQSIKQTLKSAYYTPEPIVEFIYKMIEKLNIRPKRILEPSVGHGIFIEKMPKTLRNRAEITAIEIDEISCKIIRSLYSDVNLQQMRFENFKTEDYFDLIIGNPPYGSNIVMDENNKDISEYCIHHYFVAKCMRLLKPGGLLAMVLPSYFLDNQSKHVRKIIADEGGNLLAAYRLPDDMFDDAKVTVDVVFLVKEKPTCAWWNLGNIRVDDESTVINQYFINHPEHIIGRLAKCQIYDRRGLTCKREGDPFTRLNSFLQNVTSILQTQKPDIVATKAMLLQKIADIDLKLQALNQEKQLICNALKRFTTFEQELGKLLLEVEPLLKKAA